MKIEVTQCSMCTHYNTEQFCEVWKQYISNDAFYCACGVKADRKTESNSEKTNNSTISKMEQVEDEPQTDDFKACVKGLTLLWIYNYVTDDEFHRIDARLKCKGEPQTDCDHKCIQTEIGCERTDCPWK